MGRRRITKGGTKGKKPRVLGRGDARIKKWNTIADIPLDDEEQFHANRDKVLLNGGNETEDLDEVDEVFALKGLSDEEEETSDPAEDGAEDEDEDEEGVEEAKSKPTAAKKKKVKAPSTSEEEDESEEDMEESWGKGKNAYYSSNMGQIDSEDEEANQLEEQEALKLQSKARDNLSDDDFGFAGAAQHDAELSVDAMLPTEGPPAPAAQDVKSLLRHLEKTSPETIALAHDWEDTASNLIRTKQAIEEASPDMDPRRLGEIHLHYQTLLTYATTLAFYFYLRTGSKYSRKPELLQSHPIMTQLLVLKNALTQLEQAEFPVWVDSDSLDEDEELSLDAEQLWRLAAAKGLDKDELENLLREANITINPPTDYDPTEEEPKKKKKKNKKQAEGTPDQPMAPPKKKRKTQTEKAVPDLPVFDLVEPKFTSTAPSTPINAVTPDNAYGELTSLDHADAADKTVRRKTLRFHTSKIESASARRQGARSAAFGGDDDIPYKEKKREREARLAREAAARSAGQGGEDLDDVEPEPEQPARKKRPRADDDDDEGSDPAEYYDLVKKQKSKKKAEKRAEYEEERAASRQFEEDDASGPRSLTRAILKNKGLTPHRPKSVRNPRVKKREKYQKAKKKVASQKAVYRGGVGTSGKYEGERTGITKVAKGIKLS